MASGGLSRRTQAVVDPDFGYERGPKQSVTYLDGKFERPTFVKLHPGELDGLNAPLSARAKDLFLPKSVSEMPAMRARYAHVCTTTTARQRFFGARTG